SAQEERISMEHAKGTAEMQADLAKSKVGAEINTNNAAARAKEGGGEAENSRLTGPARQADAEDTAHAGAKANAAQVSALGPSAMAVKRSTPRVAARAYNAPSTSVWAAAWGRRLR